MLPRLLPRPRRRHRPVRRRPRPGDLRRGDRARRARQPAQDHRCVRTGAPRLQAADLRFDRAARPGRLILVLPLPLGVAGHKGATVVVGLNGLGCFAARSGPCRSGQKAGIERTRGAPRLARRSLRKPPRFVFRAQLRGRRRNGTAPGWWLICRGRPGRPPRPDASRGGSGCGQPHFCPGRLHEDSTAVPHQTVPGTPRHLVSYPRRSAGRGVLALVPA